MKIEEKDALEEAIKMMSLPMKDLPELAIEFLKYLAKYIGMCGETCLTAYAVYNQIVLNMPCKDENYQPS